VKVAAVGSADLRNCRVFFDRGKLYVVIHYDHKPSPDRLQKIRNALKRYGTIAPGDYGVTETDIRLFLER
jgi:hypothetical protein